MKFVDPNASFIGFTFLEIVYTRFHLRLFPVQDFISLFPKMPYHQKCLETVNETTPKMHGFILEFHKTKFYVVPLIVYVIK
jgi:hypothetical protein